LRSFPFATEILCSIIIGVALSAAASKLAIPDFRRYATIMAATKHPTPKPDDAEQSARFIEAAKAAEVDETGEAFERAVKLIVPEKKRSQAAVSGGGSETGAA
jgi:hypothetical protein